VTAVIYELDAHREDAYPPYGFYFDANYAQATAVATPGNPGQEDAESFTHTVFVEEGTGTWCGWCPYVRDTLKVIERSGLYEFAYVSLVEDLNGKANYRIRTELNTQAWPTTFFDGGDQVLVGAQDMVDFTNRINACGARAVASLEMVVGLDWIGQDSGKVNIRVRVANNTAANVVPPDPTITEGPTEGEIEVPVSFTASTTDPDTDMILSGSDLMLPVIPVLRNIHTRPMACSMCWSDQRTTTVVRPDGRPFIR